MKNFLYKYHTWLFLLLALIFIGIETDKKNDVFIFLSASNDLFNDVNIYTKPYVDGYHYYYSAFFCMLLKPFTYLPFNATVFIWLAINLLLLYRSWRIISAFIGIGELTSSLRARYITFLSFLFILRFTRDNFHHGQMTVLMVYLMLEGVSQINRKNFKTGAFALALGINIKLLPIVLLPYLLWRKELKAAAFCVLFYILLMLFPCVLFGTDRTFFLIKEWWTLVSPFSANHLIDKSETFGFQSLSSAIPALLPHCNEKELGLILNLSRLILISFSLYFLNSKPFRPALSKLSVFREVSYLILIVPLIFPHQQHYSFFCVLPAAVYIINYLFSERDSLSKTRFRLICVLMSLSYLCFNLTILLGVFNDYYEHYKIITCGALLMIFPLALCKPAAKQHLNSSEDPSI